MPFLQRIVHALSIVPLLTGEVAPPAAAVVLEAALDGGAFGIISSDLSHYLGHEAARRRDAATAAVITALRWSDLERADACGRTGIQAALIVAASRGWQCELLDLRTSGDTAGSRDRVVGYGAFVIGPPR